MAQCKLYLSSAIIWAKMKSVFFLCKENWVMYEQQGGKGKVGYGQFKSCQNMKSYHVFMTPSKSAEVIS